MDWDSFGGAIVLFIFVAVLSTIIGIVEAANQIWLGITIGLNMCFSLALLLNHAVANCDKGSSKLISTCGAILMFTVAILIEIYNFQNKLSVNTMDIIWTNALFVLIPLVFFALMAINEKISSTGFCSTISVIVLVAGMYFGISAFGNLGTSSVENNVGEIESYIVIEDNVNVYKDYTSVNSMSADKLADVVTVLHKGEIVERLGGIGGGRVVAVNIRTSDGIEGWVAHTLLEVNSYKNATN